MRNLFIACAKLLGLLSLFWAILVIPQISIYIGILATKEQAKYATSWLFLGLLMYFLLSMLFGLALLFKTEKIADMLKISKSIEEPRLNTDDLLRIGLVLVGAFLLVSAIPKAVQTIFEILRHPRSIRFARQIPELISVILKIGLASLLTFSTGKVITIINMKKNQAT